MTLNNMQAVMIAEGEEEQIAAWQHLVNTGLAWRLQGWFGRTARQLIDAGIIEEA